MPDLESMPETIVAEIKFHGKNIFFVLSYCHPNLTSSEFAEYTKSLGNIYESINKEYLAITIIMHDPHFFGKMTLKIVKDAFSAILIFHSLEKFINEPTHIRDDGSQSFIDLICTDQPFFSETGMLPSPDSHSKHNIQYGSLYFHIPRQQPYRHKVWNYKTAKIDLIRKELLCTN